MTTPIENPEAHDVDPPALVLATGAGTGKTEAAIKAVARFMALRRAQERPHRVLWFAPTHALSDETAVRLRGAGVNAFVWRGREAPAPGAPDTTMCENLEAVERARSVGVSAERGACGTRRGPRCTHFDRCRYRQQFAGAAGADVIVAASDMLFQPPPRAWDLTTRPAGCVVIDENFVSKGIGVPLEVELSSFLIDDPIVNAPRLSNDTERAQWFEGMGLNLQRRLSAANRELYEALATLPDGPVARDSVPGGLRWDAEQHYTNEYRRAPRVHLRPNATAEELALAEAAAETSQRARGRGRVWKAIDDVVGGKLRLEKKGTTLRIHRMKGRGEGGIHPAYLQLPLLILDATYRPALAAPLFTGRAPPRSRPRRNHAPTNIVRGYVRGSHEHIRLISAPASKGRLKSSPATVNDIVDYCTIRYLGMKPGSVAVICNKGFADELGSKLEQRLGFRPEILTFNSLVGIDKLKTVSRLIVIGRTMPSTKAVQEQVVALTGEWSPLVADPVVKSIGLTDGTGRAVRVRQTGHGMADEVLAAISSDEIVQAVARARGVVRDAAHSVEIDVLCNDVCPEMVFDEAISWSRAAPGPMERQLSRTGLALSSPTAAARKFPELFKSAEAAKKEWQRRSGGQSLLDNIQKQMSPTSILLAREFPAQGKGDKPARVLVCANHIEPNDPAQATKRLNAPTTIAQIGDWYLPSLMKPTRITPESLQTVLQWLGDGPMEFGLEEVLRNVCECYGGQHQPDWAKAYIGPDDVQLPPRWDDALLAAIDARIDEATWNPPRPGRAELKRQARHILEGFGDGWNTKWGVKRDFDVVKTENNGVTT